MQKRKKSWSPGRPSRYNHHKVQNGDRSRQDENGFQRVIKITGQRLEEVEDLKYLGTIISNEGSKPEIRGARWLSGRVSDFGARGRGFGTYRRRVVSLSKTLFNCWFSSAPVFQWCCSTPQGSPGVGRNTFLSCPHLCFIIVFICDLFVSRDDPLMS